MAYFLKKTRKPRGLYLQIYESYYDPERGPRNRSFKTIGYLDDLARSGIADPVAFCQTEVEKLNAKGKRTKNYEQERKIGCKSPVLNVGCFPIAALLNNMNIQKPLNSLALSTGLELDFYEWLKLHVLDLSIRWACRHEEYGSISEPYSSPLAFNPKKGIDERETEKNLQRFADENFETIAAILNQAAKQTFELSPDDPELQMLDELFHTNMISKSRNLTADQKIMLQMDSWMHQQTGYEQLDLDQSLNCAGRMIVSLAVWLRMIFEKRILEGRFHSDAVDCFIKDFRIVSIPNGQFVNLAEGSELLSFLANSYLLPVNHYYLGEKEIDRLFQTSFQGKIRK